MFPSVVVKVEMVTAVQVATVDLVASRCRLDLPILMIPQVPLVDLLLQTEVVVPAVAVTVVVVLPRSVPMVLAEEVVDQPLSVTMVV